MSNPDNPELKNIKLRYTTFDKKGTEKIRLLSKPSQILIDGAPVATSDNLSINSFIWQPLKNGGILRINRINGNEVTIMD